MKKLNIGIIFGGRSGEHEVSLQSAKNIIEVIDKKKFNITLIGIDKKGAWGLYDAKNYLKNIDDPKRISLNKCVTNLCVVPFGYKYNLNPINSKKRIPKIDVFFPVLHGTFGEDGTIQGLFELMDVAYVGAPLLSSAIIMDKDITKRLLKESNIPVCDFISIRKTDWEKNHENILCEIKNKFTLPIFTKPANLGSSIGIIRVNEIKLLHNAISEAFKYDNKILIEKGIIGREIELSVLGNEDPIASEPGELIPKNGFYSYDAKYIDPDGARFVIPANLDKDIISKFKSLAINAFKTLDCLGMARVDFFYDEKNNKIYINELNTIPGFTKISMYPKLWEASGISYTNLITRLIELACERHNKHYAL
jgi:D-alanine-D-alanine ligase